ncbi:MAG: dihydrofolate reductase [Bacteroidales bacterium]
MKLGLKNNPDHEDHDDFQYKIEQFDDIKIMRYKVPGFDRLSLEQKKLLYYLSEAARCGRDIIFDQHFEHNIKIRKLLDVIVETYRGDRNSEYFQIFMVYVKKFWFSNGFHHHYSSDKFVPGIDREYFLSLLRQSDQNQLPVNPDYEPDALHNLMEIIFDNTLYPKGVSQDTSRDIVKASAVNFYKGVSKEEVQGFYQSLLQSDEKQPVSYGLNSRLIKENGEIQEQRYREEGLYDKPIRAIISWLEKAAGVAENEQQKQTIAYLIDFYKTGDLKLWDTYSISWVNDQQSHIDFINGFIENYTDPMGMKATWESVVNFQDVEATKRTRIIADNAQWFEDRSPVDARFRKAEVKGVSAKVITVVQLGGDCFPASPIGINLPNADWIRKEHGSKSVTMENITMAYDKATQGSGMLEEFVYDEADRELSRKYGAQANNLHTDLHECLGHGSGQLLPGVSADALQNYASPLEEARADLYALYFMMDPQMLKLGLIPNMDLPKAEYNAYIRNGLMTQLTRIKPGKDIEQAHMRNRQIIAKWVYEKGKADQVIEKFTEHGKTYVRVQDHQKLRELFGQLLAEVQRIKSEGDYPAGKNLVEKYGVKVDRDLHNEVLERFARLGIAPYGGFMNPDFNVIREQGAIKDIKIFYPDNYTEQMLDYGRKYGYL